VFVDQPSVTDTISILRGLRERYELHHGVKISDSALVEAAVLSDRYIADRFLPGGCRTLPLLLTMLHPAAAAHPAPWLLNAKRSGAKWEALGRHRRRHQTLCLMFA
jgi:hypothetical protein